MMLKLVQNGKLPFTKFEYVLAWFYRETICLYLFLKAASNPTVKWRDGKYRLKWGGLAEEILEKKSVDIQKTPIKSNSNLIDEKSYQFLNINSSSLITNGKKILNHKRNNSYSVLMNSNNNNNSNSLNNNNTSNISGESTINENALNLAESKSQITRPFHQHHHSISTPISAQAYPQLLVQITNEIDISDLKFKDSKQV